MKRLKAILFDFDGTLVNSEKFHFEIMNEVLAEHGAAVSWDEYLKVFMGVPFSKNAPMLVERHSLPMTPKELVAESEGRVKAALPTRPVEPMDGANAALNRLSHVRKAVVTGSGRESVEQSLKALDWSEHFEFLVTFDDVQNSKPDPESYQQALEKLGVETDEVVVFEDTENGTKSAKAAGLTCYAIQHNVDYHYKLSDADRIFISIEEALNFVMRERPID